MSLAQTLRVLVAFYVSRPLEIILGAVHTTPKKLENGGFTLKTHQMFSVHTMPEEFENGGFSLKTHQTFSVHTTPEKFENLHCGFMFEENSGREITLS